MRGRAKFFLFRGLDFGTDQTAHEVASDRKAKCLYGNKINRAQGQPGGGADGGITQRRNQRQTDARPKGEQKKRHCGGRNGTSDGSTPVEMPAFCHHGCGASARGGSRHIDLRCNWSLR